MKCQYLKLMQCFSFCTICQQSYIFLKSKWIFIFFFYKKVNKLYTYIGSLSIYKVDYCMFYSFYSSVHPIMKRFYWTGNQRAINIKISNRNEKRTAKLCQTENRHWIVISCSSSLHKKYIFIYLVNNCKMNVLLLFMAFIN